MKSYIILYYNIKKVFFINLESRHDASPEFSVKVSYYELARCSSSKFSKMQMRIIYTSPLCSLQKIKHVIYITQKIKFYIPCNLNLEIFGNMRIIIIYYATIREISIVKL